MTDYNDGKWHGWNGGECPVHPESVVDVRFYIAYSDAPPTATADKWNWDGPDAGAIVAFRVVKPFREPREWWACGDMMFGSLEKATRERANSGRDGFSEIIHVREVLE